MTTRYLLVRSSHLGNILSATAEVVATFTDLQEANTALSGARAERDRVFNDRANIQKQALAVTGSKDLIRTALEGALAALDALETSSIDPDMPLVGYVDYFVVADAVSVVAEEVDEEDELPF